MLLQTQIFFFMIVHKGRKENGLKLQDLPLKILGAERKFLKVST
jgi:hypothetical protein